MRSSRRCIITTILAVFGVLVALAGCTTQAQLDVQLAAINAQKEIAIERIRADQAIATARSAAPVATVMPAPGVAVPAAGFMPVQASPIPAIQVPQVSSPVEDLRTVAVPLLGFLGQVATGRWGYLAAVRQSDNARDLGVAQTNAQRDVTVASYGAMGQAAQAQAAAVTGVAQAGALTGVAQANALGGFAQGNAQSLNSMLTAISAIATRPTTAISVTGNGNTLAGRDVRNCAGGNGATGAAGGNATGSATGAGGMPVTAGSGGFGGRGGDVWC